MSNIEWEIPEDLPGVIELDLQVPGAKKLSGVIYDLSNKDYHEHPSISKSGLDLIAKSPAHFKKSVRTETTAFKQGTLIHCAVLEPDFLDSRYLAIPEKLDLRTKIGKEKAIEYAMLAGDRIVISVEEMHMATRIRQEVSKHKIAGQLFDGGVSESSIFSNLSDVDVRCRPDYLHIDSGICVDLKSCECAGEGFHKSMTTYRYWVQAPFYLAVMAGANIDIEHFIFVCVEKTEPFGVGIYTLDDDTFEYGRREYNRCLDIYKKCLDTDEWPCYPEEIRSLRLPYYMLKDL